VGFPNGCRLSVQQSSHAGCGSKNKDSVHYTWQLCDCWQCGRSENEGSAMQVVKWNVFWAFR
jgi:hypothetical protein